MSNSGLVGPPGERIRTTGGAGNRGLDRSFFRGGPQPMEGVATEALGSLDSRSGSQGEMYEMSRQRSAALG